MKLFDVYPVYDINIVKGQGDLIWDEKGTEYVDLYGGHAVISIGHSHPTYVERLKSQIDKIGFYSNSVVNKLQIELADKLGKVSGYEDYALFYCNSGAEANENAVKLASFHTGKGKVISFTKGFHGRTSFAVAITDNKKIVSKANETENAIILPFNDKEALKNTFEEHNDIAAVIIEGIQGIAGINVPDPEFLQLIRELCDQNGACYIADAVQCGYGRSGKFFSHDYAEAKADIYTLAKGMGNGFPIGGIIAAPHFKPWYGMLGTTFGGNYMACQAGIAVLEVFENENCIQKAANDGEYVLSQLKGLPKIKEVRGKGLMIGIELEVPMAEIRKRLLFEHKLFTGSSSNPNTLRLLPALNVKREYLDRFVEALSTELSKI